MSDKKINHGQTVRFKFSTNAAAGSRVAFSNALEAADIRVYKNDSATERSSTAGFTVTSAFDSMVGVHHVAIDTSDDTDAGFFRPGNDYQVVLYPDETVDSLDVAAEIGSFSINPRTSDMPYVGVLQAAGSTSSITLPTECPATTDALIGCTVVPLSGTGKDQAGRQITAYTSGRVATLDPPLTTAVDTTTYVGIVKSAAAPATTLPKVDVTQVGTSTSAVTNLKAMFDGTGYAGGTIKLGINLVQILGTTLTETAGQIAAAFKQFFDVGTPTGTMKAITNVVTATNLTNAPTSGDLTTAMKASVNAEVVDVIRTDTVAELAAVPAATSTLMDKVNFLFMRARNKMTQTAATQILKADDGSTTVATSTVSDDGTTATRGEFS